MGAVKAPIMLKKLQRQPVRLLKESRCKADLFLSVECGRQFASLYSWTQRTERPYARLNVSAFNIALLKVTRRPLVPDTDDAQ